MKIYNDKMYPGAEVMDTKYWERPPPKGRSKYSLIKMDDYFGPKILHIWEYPDNVNRLTRTEVLLRILPITPKKFFRGTHLRYYERDLKERLFKERLTNKR